MNIATLAGHLAFGLIAFSFLVKDIFWLRIVSIAASLFSVFYNYTIPVEPMWLAINWNFVCIAVNVYHIGVILYEKRAVKMDEKDEELYQTLFKEMTPVEYLKISRAAEWVTLKSGQRIITQGMPVPGAARRPPLRDAARPRGVREDDHLEGARADAQPPRRVARRARGRRVVLQAEGDLRLRDVQP